jgi:predicted DNA-binding transcriptional regulator AlpA
MEGKSHAIARGESPQRVRSLVLHATDAAKVVGLSESTLAKLRLNGNGPAYCKLGRRVVYRPDDLDRWLQSRTTTDTTDANARFLEALTAAHPREHKAKNA